MIAVCDSMLQMQELKAHKEQMKKLGKKRKVGSPHLGHPTEIIQYLPGVHMQCSICSECLTQLNLSLYCLKLASQVDVAK